MARLRKQGFDGRLTLVGEEPVLPYQRPPLSKGYLLGEVALERLYLRPESFYAEKNIELRLGQTATGIDPQARRVQLGETRLDYDDLVLTTGSAAWRLPEKIGGDLPGVYLVRSLADVDAMRGEFAEGRRLLVVGGGYIGLEAAAVAAKLGLRVTLIEMADRILQRVAAPETARYFRKLHTDHGVEIREGIGLTRILGTSHATGAELSDGSSIEADFVIAGCGVVPGKTLAEAAGLEIENGIRTDALGRTSDPHIWAAGDCTSFPWRGGRLRLESVQNAIDQAECVADNLLGADRAYEPHPWFWSDQYDVKLQIAGLNTGYRQDRRACR